MIGVETQPWASGDDAQRLVRPRPSWRPIGGRDRVTRCERERVGAIHAARSRTPDDAEVVAPAHLDLAPEDHLLQVVDQRVNGSGLYVREHAFAVVDEVEVVLNASIGIEDERLRPHANRQLGHVLRRQRVQPREPVVAGDLDHRTLRQVDPSVTTVERTLLAKRVAVVPRDARVRRALGRRHRGLGHWAS